MPDLNYRATSRGTSWTPHSSSQLPPGPGPTSPEVMERPWEARPGEGGSDPTRPGPRGWNLLETDLELATSLSFRRPGRIVAAGTRRVHPDQRKS